MHEGFDGRKQRNALNAAEQTVRALGAGDAAKTRRSAAKATELDQIGIYREFAQIAAELADRLEQGEAIDEAGWDRLVDSLGIGPLSGLVSEVRG